ncbi:hypothetical protein [Paenibacillus alvei]|uniref:hypothetical protein n=1 Tax=Paenibacillus alvei TaxID=44250 RepID=UPI00227F0737|nr:hypothetical protein [Paenibacillus alvei]
MFQHIHPCSPVEQGFIWLSEYDDGSFLSEYNFEDKQENLFSAIDKERLVRFGLIGHGLRFYYEICGGSFKLDGKRYELTYVMQDGEIPLTGQQIKYNDIISYKTSEMYIHPGTLETIVPSTITAYTFGYKTTLTTCEDMNLQFKALTVIPYDHPAYLHLRLVSSKELDGDLLITCNGETVHRVHAPLRNNVAGELQWIIQEGGIR